MEINMKIFECNFETANGDIHHQVHIDWDDKGNLKFAEIDEGEGVQECWNRDSYEHFFTVDAEDIPKFFLYVLRKGFNSDEELTVATLQELCDAYKIKYTTDFWC
ncbi:MAG: hypothetical protein NT02SARS_1240 [SAR86 cluster bacterium SAR86B]|uniref:Uncharacterized protein n=1 Tax=SAR86 cluster bacterium SAR86B TaxID=1123867 RepID=J4WVM6_9GAMM|nr:MAG: hypothetical protein NT02SARS_1240 [SAR86 cluster bacterium SAR86B]